MQRLELSPSGSDTEPTPNAVYAVKVRKIGVILKIADSRLEAFRWATGAFGKDLRSVERRA